MKTRRESHDQDQVAMGPFPHIEVTATTTVKLFKVPAGKRFRVERVEYLNPTGLAEHADNWFNIQLQKGASTVIANHNTDSDEDGTIAADTFTDLGLTATDEDRVIVGGAAAAADTAKLVLTEGGTATLPAGQIMVYGRYV